jgi:hypothetical protein
MMSARMVLGVASVPLGVPVELEIILRSRRSTAAVKSGPIRRF